uniref:Sec-independent protein translocase TatB-like protein n=1 Tax=Medicago truncatula TaxID=3880 RepID=I3T6H3_MEDTR|nr:unknown [Medicago truncatula]
MLGFSFGEIFLLLGATAAVIGPKDLPMISRTAGRLAGRAVGYVQLARGQFDSVMQRSQVNQVHKELQETMAQLEAIRHEIGSISFINPGPSTRRHDNLDQASISNDNRKPEYAGVNNSISSHTKDSTSLPSKSLNMQSQATAYASLAQAPAVKNGSSANSTEVEDVKVGLQLIVMPVSAENTGLLPNRGGADVKGFDIVQEAILEAEVAHNAKEFFSQPQNQI